MSDLIRTSLVVAIALSLVACGSSPTTPSTPSPNPTPTQKTASFTVTFDENPVPFRSSGCNVSNPQGWHTSARILETNGVGFTPTTLVQKLDGSPSSLLAESFSSRFGACAGSSYAAGTIAANGSACGSVGVCTSSSFSTYQFQITGTDANGHSLTFDSPVLQLGPR